MNKLTLYSLLTLLAIALISCQKDEVIEKDLSEGEIIKISSNIDEDAEWKAKNTYIIESPIELRSNANLTIEPGTIIKSSQTGAIVINQGSKIFAEGTEDAPIIFTSVLDSIQEGQLVSPNLTNADRGLWPGIFILGNAPASVKNGLPGELYVLPADSINYYGGDIVDDNSGILRYVSIRHAGYTLVEEENGNNLNLAGVGNGTIIDHVECFASSDDAIAIDGGSVNITNLITHSYDDDGVDIDRGYQGSINNHINISSSPCDNVFELDAGEGDENPAFTISNASCQGLGNRDYIDFRNVNCTISDMYFFFFDTSAEVELDDNATAEKWVSESLNINNFEFSTNTDLSEIFVDKSDGGDAFEIRVPDAQLVSSPSTGADISNFENWSLTSALGELDLF